MRLCRQQRGYNYNSGRQGWGYVIWVSRGRYIIGEGVHNLHQQGRGVRNLSRQRGGMT